MDNSVKSKTRIAFIQYIFLSLSSKDDANDIKNEFNEYFHNLVVSSINKNSEEKIIYNKNMFDKLSENYINFIKNNNLNLLINPFIDFDRKFE